jgi:hypothetical protein
MPQEVDRRRQHRQDHLVEDTASDLEEHLRKALEEDSSLVDHSSRTLEVRFAVAVHTLVDSDLEQSLASCKLDHHTSGPVERTQCTGVAPAVVGKK